MNIRDILTVLLLVVGCVFFLAGTVGLLRFPDVYTRLHAITKADNVGLGLVIAALAVQANELVAIGEMLLIWLLVLLASSSACHLVARTALHFGIKPWKR